MVHMDAPSNDTSVPNRTDKNSTTSPSLFLRSDSGSKDLSAEGSPEKWTDTTEIGDDHAAEHMPLLVPGPLRNTGSTANSSGNGYVDIRITDVAASEQNTGPTGQTAGGDQDQNKLIRWLHEALSFLRRLRK